MARITIADLQKIKERVLVDNALRDGEKRVRVTIHMGTCGIASGAKTVLDVLMEEIGEAKVQDIAVTTSGCMGLCSREPLVTVEVLGQEPIKYEFVNPAKMKQIFKRHIIMGEVQTTFVLAKGQEKIN